MKRIDSLRIAGDLPKEWFLNLVVSGGWTLALSALSRWSHWIKPLSMKRRYDTRFFLACMPSGQRCSPDSHEITHGLWVSPINGLMGNISGKIPLSPPTMVTLQELLKYPTLEDLKKGALTRMWGTPNSPRLIALDKGAVLIEPWDAEFGQAAIDQDLVRGSEGDVALSLGVQGRKISATRLRRLSAGRSQQAKDENSELRDHAPPIIRPSRTPSHRADRECGS